MRHAGGDPRDDTTRPLFGRMTGGMERKTKLTLPTYVFVRGDNALPGWPAKAEGGVRDYLPLPFWHA